MAETTELTNADKSTATAAIEVTNISKRYGRTLALDDLSVTIPANSTFALLGPNGAGKTTLIHILCTILRPDSGRATICGFDVIRQPRQARRCLGVIFQEPSLDARLTVQENLDFHGLVYSVPKVVRRRRIEELLELVDLSDWRNKLVQTLSAGMKRRVEIARALIHDSKVVILDEPTVGLDAQSRENMWGYLKELRKARPFSLVVTTHYIEEVDQADMVCIIDHGKVLALDTPGALRSTLGNDIIRITPRDSAAATAMLERFPDATVDQDGVVSIVGPEGDVMEMLIRDYGQHLRSLSYDQPSLESVFLKLTGRAIRETSTSKRM